MRLHRNPFFRFLRGDNIVRPGVCAGRGCKSRGETRKYGSIDRVQHCACIYVPLGSPAQYATI